LQYSNNNKITPFCEHFYSAGASQQETGSQPMLLHCCTHSETWYLKKVCKVLSRLD